MKVNAALAYVGHNSRDDRNKDDFYPTPRETIVALLEKQRFDGDIWECACGDGAISTVLEEYNYKVYSSDLVDRGYGQSGIDFLLETQRVDNIVTNPPFNLATEFTLHALTLARKKVVMLSKISFLEGIKRRDTLFSLNKLEKVIILSRRVPFKKKITDKKANGLMAFGWFVFDVNHNNPPIIDWI